MEITQHHITQVSLADPCEGNLDHYKPGMSISKIRFSDAIWVEDKVPHIARELSESIKPNNLVFGNLPLFALGVGVGYGDGYGDGDGDGVRVGLKIK